MNKWVSAARNEWEMPRLREEAWFNGNAFWGNYKMAPPRRLELRSSAPEADTLSTELRGRAKGFYHQKSTSEVCKTSEVDLSMPLPVALIAKLHCVTA